MPTYVYYCSTCDEEMELDLPITKSGVNQKCPKCKKSMTKIISQCNVIISQATHPARNGRGKG